MSKQEVLKKAYPVLIECFAGWHGEIFQEYWRDPDCEESDRVEIAYKSIEECYKELREEIYEDEDEIWKEIDNEVGDDPYEKIRRILLYNESHGEVWGSVCSKLYYSTNEECWKLLANLLVSLSSDRGEIGWDS